ncbi:hypothetical protein KAW18_04055, partial [candidate division WOR-3 bacterium]|nr:hypothetical protein [candidate division WOR-3 bacterium]
VSDEAISIPLVNKEIAMFPPVIRNDKKGFFNSLYVLPWEAFRLSYEYEFICLPSWPYMKSIPNHYTIVRKEGN